MHPILQKLVKGGTALTGLGGLTSLIKGDKARMITDTIINAGLYASIEFGLDFEGLNQRKWKDFVSRQRRLTHRDHISGTTRQTFGFKNTIFEDISPTNQKNFIFGLPFNFNPIADPEGRLYNNTILKDSSSSFVSFIPGMPKFNAGNVADRLIRGVVRGSRENSKRGFLDGTGMFDKDKRYYVFDPDYGTYFEYASTMLQTVYQKMGLNDQSGININRMFETYNFNFGEDKIKKALSFFVNGLTSSVITENASNNYGDSSVDGATNAARDAAIEANYISGFGSNSRFQDNITGRLAGFVSSSMEISKRLPSVKDFGSDGAASLIGMDPYLQTQMRLIMNGMKLTFPQVWSDSNFMRSVNLQFKFHSPYGDPASIFEYVFKPFVMLLCLALPRQKSEIGFVAPMLINAVIPGLVNVDMGVITNIAWIKGGTENLWTEDNLPRCIDVDITIQDIYQVLMISRNNLMQMANPNMGVFLNSLTGISMSLNKHSMLTDSYFNNFIESLDFNNEDTFGYYSNGGTVNSLNSYNSRFSNQQRRTMSGRDLDIKQKRSNIMKLLE